MAAAAGCHTNPFGRQYEYEEQLYLAVDGSATTDLKDLAAQDASVRIDGSGDADLRVSRSLELIVEGSGDVTYRGRPSVSSRLEGSGNVRQLDD